MKETLYMTTGKQTFQKRNDRSEQINHCYTTKQHHCLSSGDKSFPAPRSGRDGDIYHRLLLPAGAQFRVPLAMLKEGKDE